ncbi:MAG: NAD-dependent epimerase/dehydratase family protein [bacterium]|nr:NAD-dependent epimerase/dehydratase family protein [bacterium]
MRVLVSGATGFLGGRVASALAEAGHTVRGFVRDPTRWDAPQGAEVAVGDVTHRADVLNAAENCDVIFHAAAMVKMWHKDPRRFERVNVEGLSFAADAARQHGARLVYVSSFVALGPTDGATFDEETPRAGTEFHNEYERTKWIADRMARKLSEGGLPLVRLYPGVVFGPGVLTAGNHVVKLLLDHAAGKLPGMLGSGALRQCFAYVEDVVRGCVAAVDGAPDGSGFILGGENKTAIELFAAFEAASGIAPPKRKIPFAIAALIGKLQRWRANWTGVEPELTDEVVGIYRHEWAYSSQRACDELGYRVTPFDEAVAATVDWLRECGRLPRAEA